MKSLQRNASRMLAFLQKMQKEKVLINVVLKLTCTDCCIADASWILASPRVV